MRALAVAGAAVLASVLTLALTGARDAPAQLRLVPVVSGLKAPLFATAAPGEPDRLYVVEQAGRILVVERGAVRGRPFLDLRAKVKAGGEQGLLGLAFAPDYARSRIFVVNYTDRRGDTRVVRYRSDGTRALPASARQLLFVRQPYANHNGGMVAYGPDGLLYVGMGDGGSGGDPQNRAQNMSSVLGKLLRLDPRRPGAPPRIVALGLRNPWRFSFDRRTNDLYIGDPGQSKLEEVDWVAWPWRGLLNFGWNVYEGRASFEKKPLGPGRLVQPLAQYRTPPGGAVIGGYVYRGSAVPVAAGRYFYGDFGSGEIWSLEVVGGRASAPRREPFRVPALTSFGQDLAGELYLVSGAGTVYRLAAG